MSRDSRPAKFIRVIKHDGTIHPIFQPRFPLEAASNVYRRPLYQLSYTGIFFTGVIIPLIFRRLTPRQGKYYCLLSLKAKRDGEKLVDSEGIDHGLDVSFKMVLRTPGVRSYWIEVRVGRSINFSLLVLYPGQFPQNERSRSRRQAPVYCSWADGF